MLHGASTTMTTLSVSAQHNAKYTKSLARWGYSTVITLKYNSNTYVIMLANEIPTLLCLYLPLWSVEGVEKSRGALLVFEVGYPSCKKIYVIRLVFQDQLMYVCTSLKGAKTFIIVEKGVFLVMLTNSWKEKGKIKKKRMQKHIFRVYFIFIPGKYVLRVCFESPVSIEDDIQPEIQVPPGKPKRQGTSVGVCLVTLQHGIIILAHRFKNNIFHKWWRAGFTGNFYEKKERVFK